MGGPDATDTVCTLSEPCQIVLTGVRLAHTSKVLIIDPSSTCGDPAAQIARWDGIINPAPTALLSPPVNPGFVYADGDTYDAGLGFKNPPSESHKLCWSFSPTGAAGASDYKVLVG